jgi:polysaccharide chain length determinant protein (PEP-CTERM system associated)
MEQNGMTVNDFLDIIRRRKHSIIWPALGIFLVAVLVAFLIPPTYRSTSTILIEDQEIPREYVMAIVSSYAEQRLQSINQRIMSSSRLLDVIKQFNLYPELRERWTMEEIIAKMRKDIKLETISADVADRRTGRRAAATIAFSISYDGRRPEVVQQVANALASLYLSENLKVVEQQTAGASKFIEEEMNRVQASLAVLDGKMSAFKSRNLNTLPELVQLNLQNLDRIDRDIVQLNDQLRTLKEKQEALQSQLASIPKDAANPDKDYLKELRARLVNLQTRYSNDYPDVIKTKAEIAKLERRLEVAEQQSSPVGQPDNPAYIQLSTQLTGIRSEIDYVKRQLTDTQQKRDAYQQRVVASPRVEEHYKALLTERNNTQLKYDDLMKKHMEAKVASGLERGQMGERFTLIDAARLPEKPVKPNIPAILIIGFILGIGAGVGTASLREYNDQSVRSAEDLEEATSMVVLAGIPEIVNQQDIDLVKKRRIAWIIGIVAFIVVGLVVFHFLVMDLDVFWARVMRRLAKI